MKKLLNKNLFETYRSMLEIKLSEALYLVKKREWNADNFKFATAVSVMSSSRIEGEPLDVDSFVKHKVLDIEYLPNLTEKPNDLYSAYEFARDNTLNLSNFLQAHNIATQHLLPENQRGKIRSNNMLIIEQQTQRIQYEAARASIVQHEFDEFWHQTEELIKADLSPEEAFYYASYIHLIFVKIHPFNDGNGRIARLLEKWFLCSHLGNSAWYIASEFYYYTHISSYYSNLARVGLFYEDLNYKNALPFLLMTPKAIEAQQVTNK